MTWEWIWLTPTFEILPSSLRMHEFGTAAASQRKRTNCTAAKAIEMQDRIAASKKKFRLRKGILWTFFRSAKEHEGGTGQSTSLISPPNGGSNFIVIRSWNCTSHMPAYLNGETVLQGEKVTHFLLNWSTFPYPHTFSSIWIYLKPFRFFYT